MTAVAVEQTAPSVARVDVSAAEFINAVKAVALAAGRDDSLPVLTSVSLTVLEAGLKLAATDRYRLAEAQFGFGDVKGTALVNAKELGAFVKAIKLSTKAYPHGLTVTVIVDGEAVTVDGGEFKRTFRTVNGAFPDYSKLITVEAGSVAEIRLSPKYLSDGMEAVSLMAADKRDPARFTFAATDKPCLMVPDVPVDRWSFKYLLMPMKQARA